MQTLCTSACVCRPSPERSAETVVPLGRGATWPETEAEGKLSKIQPFLSPREHITYSKIKVKLKQTIQMPELPIPKPLCQLLWLISFQSKRSLSAPVLSPASLPQSQPDCICCGCQLGRADVAGIHRGRSSHCGLRARGAERLQASRASSEVSADKPSPSLGLKKSPGYRKPLP